MEQHEQVLNTHQKEQKKLFTRTDQTARIQEQAMARKQTAGEQLARTQALLHMSIDDPQSDYQKMQPLQQLHEQETFSLQRQYQMDLDRAQNELPQ